MSAIAVVLITWLGCGLVGLPWLLLAMHTHRRNHARHMRTLSQR